MIAGSEARRSQSRPRGVIRANRPRDLYIPHILQWQMTPCQAKLSSRVRQWPAITHRMPSMLRMAATAVASLSGGKEAAGAGFQAGLRALLARANSDGSGTVLRVGECIHEASQGCTPPMPNGRARESGDSGSTATRLCLTGFGRPVACVSSRVVVRARSAPGLCHHSCAIICRSVWVMSASRAAANCMCCTRCALSCCARLSEVSTAAAAELLASSSATTAIADGRYAAGERPGGDPGHRTVSAARPLGRPLPACPGDTVGPSVSVCSTRRCTSERLRRCLSTSLSCRSARWPISAKMAAAVHSTPRVCSDATARSKSWCACGVQKNDAERRMPRWELTRRIGPPEGAR
mmetsp:Transcript_8726/g.22788  ORF Transcript_8726/g.22788 Transcript_8726/m.22788 type:complete len:350 (+) Transcript_8726:170-1219(+)